MPRLHHRILWFICGAAVIAGVRPGAAAEPPAAPRERVVLLHGLGRTSRSLLHLAGRLEQNGFEPTLIDYPSTTAPLEELAAAIGPAFRPRRPGERVHAVTHSMGGLLLRWHARRNGADGLGRVVMLAPPNEGSELADELARFDAYRRMVGPAGLQLGTGSNSPPCALGPVEFELGVIAGSATLNPLFSWLIPGPDDGKVSIARARVDGMADFAVAPSSHTWIMFDEEVIRLTIRFLRTGRFATAPARRSSPHPNAVH